MLILFVITLCFTAVSVAQQPSAACINAYNAIFPATSTVCSRAIVKVTSRSQSRSRHATENERRMVCDEDQSCNRMLRNVIDICGDTVRIINTGLKSVSITVVE